MCRKSTCKADLPSVLPSAPGTEPGRFRGSCLCPCSREASDDRRTNGHRAFTLRSARLVPLNPHGNRGGGVGATVTGSQRLAEATQGVSGEDVDPAGHPQD